MTVEILIDKISEKSKTEGVDLKIAAAMVREDIRLSGELTPEIDDNLNKADEFFLRLLYNPEIQKEFFEERFENLSCDEWVAKMENPLPKEMKRPKEETGE